MTKKKRELIEIMLDNITPDDWPVEAKFAAQDKKSLAWGKNKLMFYKQDEPPFVKTGETLFSGNASGDKIALPELCEHWSKTIVTRDEFMKRWNERNQVVDSEGWIKWNGGEMPVEKGALIDVEYRDGVVNLHVEAGGGFPSNGSVITMAANRWTHTGADSDIIAYKMHDQQQQKTPQQLALEKFGTDWHDNEGVRPVDDDVLIDEIVDGVFYKDIKVERYTWNTLGLFDIKKWRIRSATNATTPTAQQEPHTEETKPIQQEVKATDTQIGGNHYTKLAIQPMSYSMENGLDALQHTVIKYVTRFRDKNGIEDLEKAKHCINMLIEFERNKK